MNKNLNIPSDPMLMTPEWLTEALRSTHTIDKTKVKSLQIEIMDSGSGFVGQLARFKLNYTQPEAGAPESIVAKLPTADPNKQGWFTGLYEREVCIYNDLGANIGVPIPQCYYGDIDPENGNYILLLEDLSDLRQVGFADGCSYEEAKSVIMHLAQFHATWWNSSRLGEFTYLKPYNNRNENNQKNFNQRWPEFPEKIKALLPEFRLPPTFLSLGYQFGPHLTKVYNSLSNDPVTFLHRDVHLDNLFFDVHESASSIRLLDWQLAAYGRSVCDVTYFMIMSLPVALRRQTERELLQTYHNLLVQYGVQGYSFVQCWEDYQRAFFHNLTMLDVYINALDFSGPYGRKVYHAMLTRVIGFSEDHPVTRYLE
jgi:thiamine kinase-like enzyme